MRAAQQHHQSDDGVPNYLSRLTKAPLLSAEQEVALTREIQKGNKEARIRLVESNMRLVINIAKTYRNRLMPMEDMIQEGAVGLIQAAERFDPERGFRFSTYATHWVRQAISRAIDGKAKSIRLPAHITQSIRKFEKAKESLNRTLGRDPTNEEIARELGLSTKRLYMLLQASQEVLSLDVGLGENGNLSLLALVTDVPIPDPEPSPVTEDLMEVLRQIMVDLNEREKRVLHMKFAAVETGDEEGSAMEVAKDLKLSRERLRQIEVQAIKKLRALALRRHVPDPQIQELGLQG